MDRSLRIRFALLGGLFLTLLVLSLVLSSFYKATSRVKTLVLPPDVTSCSKDEDCGLTDQIGCCPCGSGGGQAAVNKRMRPQLKAFHLETEPWVFAINRRGVVAARLEGAFGLNELRQAIQAALSSRGT